MDTIAWKYYIVFCCFLAVFLAVTYFVFPETKGRSLEEIAEVFDGPGAVPDIHEAEKHTVLVEKLHTEEVSA